MNKQLKFQSKIICKSKDVEKIFVSNPLYISYKISKNVPNNMKNLYNWDKYLQIINCNCPPKRCSMFDYLTLCLKSMFC